MRTSFTLILCVLIKFSSGAQTIRSQMDRYFSEVNRSSLSTGYLLNKGSVTIDQLAMFDTVQWNGRRFYSTPLFNANQWRHLYMDLSHSYIKGKRWCKNFDSLSITDYNYDGPIPIGLLFCKANYIDPQELEQIALSQTSIGSFKNYRAITIFSASPIKDKFENDDLRFLVDPDFIYTDRHKIIHKLEIDFSDGKGFRQISPLIRSEVPVHYNSPGEKAILFKVQTATDFFISYARIYISPKMVRLPDSVMQINMSRSAVGGRNKINAGGSARIDLGCDGVLDKPVIIVEGFDATNEVSSATKISLYSQVYEALDEFGYDFVTLNFNNGGDYIQNNAEVVRELINNINQVKAGNHENIIIGESMGGLVTRYALAQMEQQGIDHETRLFISFDSPHKGANIPPGIQWVVDDINDVDVIELFNLNEGDIADLMTRLNAPAARQMLVRYKGPSPHGDFNTLQAELAALGYPQKCRNIALINGSNTAAQQNPPDFWQGDQILQATINGTGLVNGVIKVRTGALNTQTKISSVVLLFTVIPTTVRERSFNFNGDAYDIAPGGFYGSIEQASNLWDGLNFYIKILLGIFGNTYADFFREIHSFVPTVSSLDLPAGTDLFYYNEVAGITRQHLVSNNITPFDDLYAQDINTEHVNLFANGIGGLLQIIYEQEVMRNTMALQNKEVTNNRDYEASASIIAGSNVQPGAWGAKQIDQGNFTVQSGATVTMTAGTSVTLRPGFKTAPGAQLNVRTSPSTNCTSGLGQLPPPNILISEYPCENQVVLLMGQTTMSTLPVTYSWTVNGQPSPGDKYLSIAYPAPGVYNIQLTISAPGVQENASTTVLHIKPFTDPACPIDNGQMARLKDEELVTSISDESEFTVFPNPTTGDINFVVPGDYHGPVQILLFDRMGKAVKTIFEGELFGNKQIICDCGELAKGIYLYRIQLPDKAVAGKIMIQ